VKERENGFNLFNGALNPFKGFVFLFKGSSSLGKKLDVQRIKIKNLIIISLYSLLVLFVCMIIYGIWIYLGIPAKFV
jgi:polyferredoxin